jgi:hypothetical protein
MTILIDRRCHLGSFRNRSRTVSFGFVMHCFPLGHSRRTPLSIANGRLVDGPGFRIHQEVVSGLMPSPLKIYNLPGSMMMASRTVG